MRSDDAALNNASFSAYVDLAARGRAGGREKKEEKTKELLGKLSLRPLL